MQIRTTAPFTSLLRAARWLLPWTCVLGLSGAIAHATEQGLSTTLLAQPAALVELAPREVGRRPAPPGSYWVTITAVDAHGSWSYIVCLTRLELMSADVIQVPLEGLDLLVSQLCSDISR
jgi:hypothetical protein